MHMDLQERVEDKKYDIKSNTSKHDRGTEGDFQS